ncbi:MAG: glycosyltransferase family 4 protein [Candidatus Thorarchaeota archaeon]
MKAINVTIISYFYLPEYSGAALQIQEIIRNSDLKKIKYTIIAAQINSNAPKYEITKDNYTIRRIRIGNNKSIISFWIKLAIELFKIRKSTDIIFINGLKPAHSVAVLMANILRKPSIGRLSIAKSDIVFKNQGRIIGPLSKKILNLANKYIAISTQLKEEIKQSGLCVKKTEIIYNGVNRNIYFPLDKNKKNIQKNQMGYQGYKILLFVGVIDNRKGVDILLKAYKKINEAEERTKLILIGPANREDIGNKYYNSMLNLASEKRIAEDVEFLGYKSSEEISRYYQIADIFILPSRKEGMPNVIIEAMSCGLPIVGTKISGTEDLVQDKINGFLVETENIEMLSRAVIRLLKNTEKIEKMGYESIRIVEKYHNIKKISEKYLSVFNQLILIKD